MVKNPRHCRRLKGYRFDPWVRKIPWRRKWQLTPVFLPGKSHGQRSLVGYSPWGQKESHGVENTHIHILRAEPPSSEQKYQSRDRHTQHSHRHLIQILPLTHTHTHTQLDALEGTSGWKCPHICFPFYI